MSKLVTAALLSGCAFAFIAAPVSFNTSSGSVSVSQAFAKRGADDAADHNVNDDRGRGGKRNDDINVSRRGADDAADHNANDDRGPGGKRNDDITVSKRGADDAADTNEDAPNHG